MAQLTHGDRVYITADAAAEFNPCWGVYAGAVGTVYDEAPFLSHHDGVWVLFDDESIRCPAMRGLWYMSNDGLVQITEAVPLFHPGQKVRLNEEGAEMFKNRLPDVQVGDIVTLIEPASFDDWWRGMFDTHPNEPYGYWIFEEYEIEPLPETLDRYDIQVGDLIVLTDDVCAGLGWLTPGKSYLVHGVDSDGDAWITDDAGSNWVVFNPTCIKQHIPISGMREALLTVLVRYEQLVSSPFIEDPQADAVIDQALKALGMTRADLPFVA